MVDCTRTFDILDNDYVGFPFGIFVGSLGESPYDDAISSVIMSCAHFIFREPVDFSTARKLADNAHHHFDFNNYHSYSIFEYGHMRFERVANCVYAVSVSDKYSVSFFADSLITFYQ